MTATVPASEAYDGSSIVALEGLEAVYRRAAMYIGSTGLQGLHHLLWEVVDNSVDEVMGGHCDSILVTLHADGSASVEDNGRGIPVDPQRSGSYAGMPTVEMVLTVLHAGGKFGTGAYAYSGGLHGVGISVVNALSEWTEVTVDRGGERHAISFHVAEEIVDGVAKTIPGKVKQPLTYVKKVHPSVTGTLVRFLPNAAVFSSIGWHWELIDRRLRHTAFLNPGLTCVLVDERGEDAEPIRTEYCYPGGLVDFMSLLTAARVEEWQTHRELPEPLDPLLDTPVLVSGELEGAGEWQVCLQWQPDSWYRVESYVNGIETSDGGTHVDGFQAALTRMLNSYARQDHVGALTAKDPNFEATDVRTGLGVIVAVKVPEPQFQGQTKSRLGNDGVRDMVRSGFYAAMWSWMEEHPAEILAVLTHVVNEMRLRRRMADAAEKERRSQESRGYAPRSQPLPVKLSDCETSDRDDAELFIVEGDSAAGPAIMARNRHTQAILPIRGKILNVQVADISRIAGNKEVQALIAALGAGSEDMFDLTSCRYGKVVILTDADDDGRHIQLLLMTLFYRMMYPLVEAGRMYVARPPLFSTTVRDKKVYVYSDEEREEYDLNHKGLNWVRFKGLGEMNPDELGTTAIDPATRRLSQITVDDVVAAEATINTLMGNDSWAKWEVLSTVQVDANEVSGL